MDDRTDKKKLKGLGSEDNLNERKAGSDELGEAGSGMPVDAVKKRGKHSRFYVMVKGGGMKERLGAGDPWTYR